MVILETEKATLRLNELFIRYSVLKSCEGKIQEAYEVMRNSFAAGSKLLICGNGGSAADADHMSGELLKGFGQKRPLNSEWKARLGEELANNLQGALPAIPLTVFNSLSTAYGNDCEHVFTFAQLTWGFGEAGDVLLAISTSGNSKNVLHAVKVAHAKGLKTIGLTGKTGGKLKEVVGTSICVPETEVFKIQELHLPVYHTLSLMLEDTFFD